jgi:RNA polymerase sigma-70 factor (ECF subfamily)
MSPPHHPEPSGAGAFPDEQGLVQALRAGDPAAFETLVRTHGGRMLVVAKRMLRSEEDAQDAVQEALLAAFRSVDRFQGEARIATWLHRIVVNASLMKLRNRRRRPEDPIEPLLPTFLEDGHPVKPAVDWRADPGADLDRKRTRALVRECIDRLPETYRTVLILRDIEELDTQEAAAVLEVTENAVKIRLHRARQALRTLLDPHLREASA